MKLSEREQEFIREQVEKLPPIEKAVMHWLFLGGGEFERNSNPTQEKSRRN